MKNQLLCRVCLEAPADRDPKATASTIKESYGTMTLDCMFTAVTTYKVEGENILKMKAWNICSQLLLFLKELKKPNKTNRRVRHIFKKIISTVWIVVTST